MTLIKTFFSTLFATLLLTCSATAFDFDRNSPLPLDPTIRIGKLGNGLTYYIKQNAKPEGRLTLRLVVDAGSIQEAQDQRGLAHFVEHMAFNGTDRFAEQEIVQFLEGIGMRFGAHLNAYTTYNETVYRIEIPIDDYRVIDRGFDIIEDWASGISFPFEEVERERGVVREEWRSQRGALRRLMDNQYPVIFYGSRYAKRNPIGSMFVIEGAPRHRLVDFYKTWYRPDRMAVVVVGNLDLDEMEGRVIAHFDHLENPDETPEPISFEVPDHEETLFSIQTDPEMTNTTVTILKKIDKDPDQSAEDYKLNLKWRVFLGMLNERLYERSLDADPPFVTANIGKMPLGRERQAVSLNLSVIEDRLQDGMNAILGEIERVRRDGFGQAELDRTKADILRSIERIYEERENTLSGVLADEYTRNFLIDEPLPGIALELEMTRVFNDEIDLEEMNAFINRIQDESGANRVVLYTAPAKEGSAAPSEEELLSVIESAQKVVLAAYDDVEVDAQLLKEPLPATEIVEETIHEELGITEWVLGNGARVVAKPTKFRNDQILFRAFSPGGHSLVLDDEYFAAATAATVVVEGGVGDLDAIRLEKSLAGKSLSLSPFIDSLYEGFSGTASPRDLDTFFQLLYLRFTQPRLDMQAYESLEKRLRSVVANRQKSPQSVFQDAIEKAVYGDHVRHRSMSLELLNDLDPRLSLAVYKDRFEDASDFTFLFVGSFELDTLREYAKTYLGNLPSTGRKEKGRFNGDAPISGQKMINIQKGLEEQSTVSIQFRGEAYWSPENRYNLIAVRDILAVRLRNSLREDKGGTYNVSVYGSLLREPQEAYNSGIVFTCEPRKADILIKLALAELYRLQQDGPSDIEMANVKASHGRAFEKNSKENSFWLRNMGSCLIEGRAFEEISGFPKRIEKLNKKDLKEAARVFFSEENILIAKLDPEKN